MRVSIAVIVRIHKIVGEGRKERESRRRRTRGGDVGSSFVGGYTCRRVGGDDVGDDEGCVRKEVVVGGSSVRASCTIPGVSAEEVGGEICGCCLGVRLLRHEEEGDRSKRNQHQSTARLVADFYFGHGASEKFPT